MTIGRSINLSAPGTERRWGHIEKTYNDDESEKDIQRFVEEFINEKENPKDEFEIILNGTTGKEIRWAIYSILAKQKQRQEYQSQRISSLQRVVILQGMAVIVLGLSIIIFKQCLLWQMLLQQNERQDEDEMTAKLTLFMDVRII